MDFVAVVGFAIKPKIVGSSSNARIMALTPKHFEAIGRVAYEWSRLELQTQLVIARMLPLDPGPSLIVTNVSNVNSWLDMILRLAEYKQVPSVHVDEFRVLCKRIRELLPKRNDVIHGVWEIHYGELFASTGKPVSDVARAISFKKSGELIREHEFTPTEISDIAERIKTATVDLVRIAQPLVCASPNKPP